MMRRLRPNYHIKDEPQGEEEVEEEPQGPEQEQPPQNIYTTYEDMYALGENINNMYNTANALRDTTATGLPGGTFHHNEHQEGLQKPKLGDVFLKDRKSVV